MGHKINRHMCSFEAAYYFSLIKTNTHETHYTVGRYGRFHWRKCPTRPLSSVPHNVRGVHFNAERTATDTLQGPSFNVPAPQFALYTPGVAGQYVVGTNQYDQAMAQKFESTGDIFVEELIVFSVSKWYRNGACPRLWFGRSWLQ